MNTVINKVLIRTQKLSVIAILVKFYGMVTEIKESSTYNIYLYIYNIYIKCHFSISNDYTIKCKQGFSKTLKHSKSKPSFRPSHSKGKNNNSAKAHYNVISMTWPSMLHIGTIQVMF